MTRPGVDVYLSFDAGITGPSQRYFLAEFSRQLSPDMELQEDGGKVRVRFANADPTAAVAAVQIRARSVSDQLGLTDGITWALEPSP